ncbi:MAG: helix-turn-helix domain-containing protein [Streptosporangiaceae bacterium]
MATKEPQTLGAYLRAARRDAGLSIRQLARAAEINHSYLVKLETDQNDNPSAAHLQRLADVLEIDASDLLAFIGVEPSSTLPSPRVYFRRKFGLSDTEAARLSRLIAEHTNKPSNQGDRHP